MPKIPTIYIGGVYIGVDPGQKGGLAAIGPNGVYTVKMPQTERDIFRWFRKWTIDEPQGCIEHVHSFPGQGVASTFKFGVGYGGLRMAMIAADISFEEVQPAAWQRALGVKPRVKRGKGRETTHAFKQRLRAKAQQIYPSIEITLETADALLIATYCKRKREGTL